MTVLKACALLLVLDGSRRLVNVTLKYDSSLTLPLWVSMEVSGRLPLCVRLQRLPAAYRRVDLAYAIQPSRVQVTFLIWIFLRERNDTDKVRPQAYRSRGMTRHICLPCHATAPPTHSCNIHATRARDVHGMALLCAAKLAWRAIRAPCRWRVVKRCTSWGAP